MQIRDTGPTRTLDASLAAMPRRTRTLETPGLIALAVRRSLFGQNRTRLSRAATVASALFVLMYVLALILAPMLRKQMVIVELPDRIVTMLPQPAPIRPPAEKLEEVHVQQVADRPLVLPDHFSLPTPRARPDTPADLQSAAAQRGRARAQEVTAELASTTGQLDKALRDLSSALDGAQGEYTASHRTRQRGVRSGRADGDLPAASTGAASAGRADLGGSTVLGEKLSLGALAPARPSDAALSDDGTPSGGSAPGVYRTNASLLAVIRRYAAGIQYCYDSELKRDPTLKGKLVVAITVAASGAVTEARVVQNTVGSSSLTACSLGQIRDWRFPAIPTGVTTFQAPFVFTPPN